MKNITLLSLIAATLLFVGCGEETKEATTDAATSVSEAVKEDASNALEATKEKVTEAATAVAAKAEEAKAAASASAASAAEALKERAAATTAAVKEAVAPANEANAALYAKCAGCHGADGKTKALGKSEVVAGQTVSDLATKLAEYKAGTRNVSGMGMLMKGQVSSLSDEDIQAVSEYMSAM